MSRQAVETVMERWMDDPSFRSQMRQDPEGTIRRNHIELDSEEMAALSNTDWTASDEELQSRVSKCYA